MINVINYMVDLFTDHFVKRWDAHTKINTLESFKKNPVLIGQIFFLLCYFYFRILALFLLGTHFLIICYAFWALTLESKWNEIIKLSYLCKWFVEHWCYNLMRLSWILVSKHLRHIIYSGQLLHNLLVCWNSLWPLTCDVCLMLDKILKAMVE